MSGLIRKDFTWKTVPLSSAICTAGALGGCTTLCLGSGSQQGTLPGCCESAAQAIRVHRWTQLAGGRNQNKNSWDECRKYWLKHTKGVKLLSFISFRRRLEGVYSIQQIFREDSFNRRRRKKIYRYSLKNRSNKRQTKLVWLTELLNRCMDKELVFIGCRERIEQKIQVNT